MYALITGASKGIGKEIAVALAKRKYNLLLLARSENALAELAGELQQKYKVSVFYKALDLSQQGADQLIYNWCVENNYNVSFLVNNAGYGIWGFFESLALEEQQNMIQLNTEFPVALTHRLILLLKANKPSYILNVASTASYQAMPTFTIYAATKAFMVLFSRGLRLELKQVGISVTCLSPGPVRTEFADRAGMKSLKEIAERIGMNADQVAEYGVKAALAKKAEVIPGFSNKLGAFFTRIFPKSIIEAVATWLYQRA
jgi:hypothetical protein